MTDGLHAPAHPIGQLTTTELSRYRRELEHAVRELKSAPVAAELQRRLDEVVAEEQQRERARNAVFTDPDAAILRHHSE
jgi:hypothetical protein